MNSNSSLPIEARLQELLAEGHTPQQLMAKLAEVQRQQQLDQLNALNQRKSEVGQALAQVQETRTAKQAQLTRLQEKLTASPVITQLAQTWQALQQVQA